MIAAEPKKITKYQLYPEYKDSGVEWVGDMPRHWQSKPAFAVVTDECIKNSAGAESNVLSLSYGNIVERDVETNFGLLPESFNTYQIVNPGDIILRLTDLQNDKRSLRVGRSTLQGIITSAYLKLSCSGELNDRYAYRLLHSYDTTKVFYGMGGGLRQSMKFEDFRRLPFLVPPLEEQRTIAAFLDYETARIDRLIAQQQRLIELLKEKRQAVISHAVTKGLNPNAPMKDSGVEWLGQVPEHWIVRRLKHHIISMDQGWSPQCEARLAEENEFGVMKVGCVNGGVFRFSEHKALPAELEPKTEYRLKKGQLLVSRANTRELVGSAAVVDADYDQLLLCDKLYRIKLSSDASPEFVALLLGTSAYRGQIELSASGASDSMQNIGQSTIKELPIAVPPMDEANDILKYVAARLCTFDCLNNQLQQQNLLLQERRTALISAAVTGKIDLRGWTPPADEVAA
ncbi:hypothetical protein [Aeromonas enteropelogenes]|uniref:restriction endonuclease subunit S n=1 Tax=Aeromonas enteropelogenes TaxID=29489 RepID=UPI003BA064B0